MWFVYAGVTQYQLMVERLMDVLCFANGWVYPSQGSDVDDEDIDELLSDTRLLKKLKKGKISEEDFDKQMSTGRNVKHKRAGPSEDADGETE